MNNIWFIPFVLGSIIIAYLYARYNKSQGHKFGRTFVMTLVIIAFIFTLFYKNC